MTDIETKIAEARARVEHLDFCIAHSERRGSVISSANSALVRARDEKLVQLANFLLRGEA